MSRIEPPAAIAVPHFLGQGRIGSRLAQRPVPGPGQLLLRVHANALCGSERGQFYHGSQITPGHEAAGTVEAAGPGTHVLPGTPGVVFLMDYCGRCRSCRAGCTNQCLDKRADMGFTHDGGYGVYELIRENIFFPVDPDIAPAEATLLLDVMGTGSHACKRAASLRPDLASLYVAGAGPIGLGVLAMAKLLFGSKFPVVISDLNPTRLKLAASLGGVPLNLAQHNLAATAELCGLSAFDAAVDSAGKRAAREACLSLLDKRGVLVCVGHGETLELDVSRDLIAPERAVLGSEYFPYGLLAENLPLLRAHRNYLSQIITHRLSIAELQHGFEMFFGGDTGKVVIEQ